MKVSFTSLASSPYETCDHSGCLPASNDAMNQSYREAPKMCEVVLPPFQQVQSLAQHHPSYPLGYEQPQVLQVHEKSLPWPSGVDSDAPPSHPEVSPINGAWREAEPDNGIPPPPPYSTHPPPPSFDSAEQSKVRRAQQVRSRDRVDRYPADPHSTAVGLRTVPSAEV